MVAVGLLEWREDGGIEEGRLTPPPLPSHPQAFVFRTVSRSQPRRFVQCATVGSFGARWQETLYNMFTFACLFLLPLLVMLLCYGRILAAISGTMRAAQGRCPPRPLPKFILAPFPTRFSPVSPQRPRRPCSCAAPTIASRGRACGRSRCRWWWC